MSFIILTTSMFALGLASVGRRDFILQNSTNRVQVTVVNTRHYAEKQLFVRDHTAKTRSAKTRYSKYSSYCWVTGTLGPPYLFKIV